MSDWRRQLHSKARRNADHDSARISAASESQRVAATIYAITAGGAADGTTASITVTWRGGNVLASGWNRAQTFAVGDPVICDHFDDGRLYVDYPVTGQP